MGRLVLVGGGVRSGKSSFAARIAKERADRRGFLATARPYDDDMRARVARHVADRGKDFETVEEPVDVPGALRKMEQSVVVIDCLTLWLSQILDRTNDEILASVDQLVTVAKERSGETIVVTNEVGMSLHAETPLGRRFQDLAGWAHQRIARSADEIHLAVLGTVLRLL
jgi:adenosylcobinamide kinase/adenosylcobinamide-phosphate guanylyltransferase